MFFCQTQLIHRYSRTGCFLNVEPFYEGFLAGSNAAPVAVTATVIAIVTVGYLGAAELLCGTQVGDSILGH